MTLRPAALAVGLLAAGLSGCFDYGTSSVFGPLADAAGAGHNGTEAAWSVSIKAKPAQGPAPLKVAFSLQARGAPADVPWSVDFGDGSPLANASGPLAAVEHVYAKEGRHDAFITVGAGAGAARSTLAVTVLPPGAPEEPEKEVVADPVPPPPPDPVGPPPPAGGGGGGAPPPSSTSTTTGPSSSTNSSSNGTSGSASQSTSNSTSATGSSSSASSSNTTSSSGSSTSTDSPSPSPSPSPTESPSPTGSPSPTETPSPTPTPPPNQVPEASLTADPPAAPAPATVTYTANATDPDGDALSWDFVLDGVPLGNGTGADLPYSLTQTYDAPGNHTAVFTVTDGLNVVRWEVTVGIGPAEPAA